MVAAPFALLIENHTIMKELKSEMSESTHSSSQHLDNLSDGHYNFYTEVIQPQLNLLKERDFPVKLRKKL